MSDREATPLASMLRVAAVVAGCVLAVAAAWGKVPGAEPAGHEVVIRVVVGAVGQRGLFEEVERDLLSHFGAYYVKPVFRGRNVLRSRLARQYRLHRYYRLRFPGDEDIDGLLRRLEADPRIEYAAIPGIARPGGVAGAATDDTHFGEQWDLENTGQQGGKPDADIDAIESYVVDSGNPQVVLAVLDDGVDGRHRELRRRIVPFGDTVCCGRKEPYDPQPSDGEGHGTRAAGIAVAESDNGFGIAGVDKWVMLMPIKAGEGGGFGDLSVAEGIEHAVDRGVEVISMSLTGPLDTPELSDAVGYAHASGVVMVAGAGNLNAPVVGYPAAYPEVIAVGATNRFDQLDPNSAYGPDLDVVAPGRDIPTVRPFSDEDTFDLFVLTSAATPVVAGLCSVLKGVDLTLTPDQVMDIVRRSADDQVGEPERDLPGRDDFYGWGRVNLLRAVEELGLVSRDRMHVQQIRIERSDPQTLEVRVWVVDERRESRRVHWWRGTSRRRTAPSTCLARRPAAAGWQCWSISPAVPCRRGPGPSRWTR
ncbi:MAG: S8 family serine peptidase [Acidobacteriota bacterium]|nr:S8 family serine peptidase [Acidobacteriota bacterium]